MARSSAAPRGGRDTQTGGTPPARYPKRFAAKVHTETIALAANELPSSLSRADLVMLDTEHGGHSFEARVFFNNTGANADTPPDDAHGYAGSFHIFGHGGCFGDAGHCVVNDRGKAPHDLRDAHPLSPIRTELTVTDALQRALQSGGLKTVTLVPLALGRPLTADPANEDVLHYSSIKLLTYG
jgi:tyrosinase